MKHSLHAAVKAFLAGALCAPLTTPGLAQTKNNAEITQSLKFEVVSIRPSPPDSRESHLTILPDGYEAIGMPLQNTIVLAYASAPYFKHFDDVKGAPSWVSSDRYDFRAKLASNDIAQWKKLNLGIMVTSPLLQDMLREVLIDRCKLRVHSSDTTVPGYALRVGRKSSALQESSQMPVGDQGIQLADGARAVMSMQNGERSYTFYNTSMSSLVHFLTVSSKLPLEDGTGLRSHYKFVLRPITYSSTETSTEPQVDAPVPWDLRAIGMKIESIKLKTAVWFVDSITKPSPN